MYIIKEGNPARATVSYRFECPYCGCIFASKNMEWKEGGVERVEGYKDLFRVDCPSCEAVFYGRGVEQ